MLNFKSEQYAEIHLVENLNEKIRLQEYGINIFQSIQSKSALKKALKKELFISFIMNKKRKKRFLI
jgi:tRNA pseudouridine65 synthase/23S rRNA pseudouridine1911/1915/1917 synthase